MTKHVWCLKDPLKVMVMSPIVLGMFLSGISSFMTCVFIGVGILVMIGGRCCWML